MSKLKLKTKDKKNIATTLTFVGQLGINICVIVGICLFIGYQLDKFFSTTPIFIFIFCIFAIFAAFYNVYVLSMTFVDKTENKKNKSKKTQKNNNTFK